MLGLERLGMKRNVARVITFLKDQNERSARDIETATRLSQPEVSIAMRILRESEWVTEHENKSKGKGRPVKIYALRATIDEIIGYYEAKKSQDAVQTIEIVQRLKMMAGARRSG
jgi:predicted transcriptional regulator